MLKLVFLSITRIVFIGNHIALETGGVENQCLFNKCRVATSIINLVFSHVGAHKSED